MTVVAAIGTEMVAHVLLDVAIALALDDQWTLVAVVEPGHVVDHRLACQNANWVQLSVTNKIDSD